MYRLSKTIPAVALALLTCLTPIGCGKSAPVASETEKKDAREALIAALDAWQLGKQSSLPSQTPPIAFRDDDVVQGFALVSYELDPALEIKPHTDVVVNLIVRDKSGESLHRQATYQVSLTPMRTVLRNDP